jgi:hypothetical protein
MNANAWIVAFIIFGALCFLLGYARGCLRMDTRRRRMGYLGGRDAK